MIPLLLLALAGDPDCVPCHARDSRLYSAAPQSPENHVALSTAYATRERATFLRLKKEQEP